MRFKKSTVQGWGEFDSFENLRGKPLLEKNVSNQHLNLFWFTTNSIFLKNTSVRLLSLLQPKIMQSSQSLLLSIIKTKLVKAGITTMPIGLDCDNSLDSGHSFKISS